MVRVVNRTIDRASLRDLQTPLAVGVLDIFGFEDFEVNSFEQFCINFANEQLQHYFNEHIFRLEQDEYAREGIDWQSVDFAGNQATLDLISKWPTGLISLLDEESRFPGASDDSLLRKFDMQHAKASPDLYVRPKIRKAGRLEFTINHYAGPVVYNAVGFLDKNRDALSKFSEVNARPPR